MINGEVLHHDLKVD